MARISGDGTGRKCLPPSPCDAVQIRALEHAAQLGLVSCTEGVVQMARRIERQDFASAAMMRLIAAGLSQQGIVRPVPQPQGAHISRADKRDVLDAILSQHGPLAILSIADAARFMAPEPVVQALTCSKDMPDLMDRWHRLERFSHGRHRIKAEQTGTNSFRLSHHARDQGPPPSFAESLLVVALLAVLAEMIGSQDVTLTTLVGKTDAGEMWRSRGKWHAPGATQSMGSVSLSAAAVPTRTEFCGADLVPDALSALRSRLVADPVRRWTVANLAAETGASPRTLQRRLKERSLSFSRLVTEARIEVAATHLCKANGPALAEIAFLAGFADQAHFSRTFSRAVGTTPGMYRADFGR